LEWHLCEDLKKSYLAKEFEGGYRDDREQWPTIQDRMIQAMVNLDKAIRPYVDQLREVVAEGETNLVQKTNGADPMGR